MTWNDRIQDPDNSRQMRQVDITIRRNGKLTFVECRDHQSRQDVQWIEELIGRRASLKADAVIAVSSSGFTAGALNKAKSYGIISRNLHALTDLEVQAWGSQVELTLYLYQYSDLEVALCFERESIPNLDMEVTRSELTSCPSLQCLFNAAAQQLEAISPMKPENVGQSYAFRLRLQPAGFHLCGEPVLEAAFRGEATLITKPVTSPAVFAYGPADCDAMHREPTVERFDLGRTSIIHDSDRISVFLDVSQLELPPFCQFRFFSLTGQEEVSHEAVELVGVDRLRVRVSRLSVSICSPLELERSSAPTK